MPEALSGTVERVTFHSEDTGFCVLRVKLRGLRELVTVVGHLANVTPGEFLDGTGEWVHDPEHGRQLKADELRVTPPDTLEGIEKYLGSGLIKGIGPHFASRLVKAFGKEVFDVVEKTPARLKDVPGIGAKRQQIILAAWGDQKAIRDIMVFLHSHGVSTSKAVRIYKTYGAEAIELVRENPYRLARDLHGVGFKTADRIAHNLGVDPHARIRADAGLLYVLEEVSREGHCACPRDLLLDRAVQLLDIPRPVLEEALDEQIDTGNLALNPIDGKSCVYLPPLLFAETRLARRLLELMRAPNPLAAIKVDRAIEWVEGRIDVTLADAQREAIRQALGKKVLVVTGGPGVGKTTLLRSLLLILTAKQLRASLCAPTGRAARRLGEATGAAAKTIHRLLEFNPGLGRFRIDAENPLRTDVVILDEVSMVDVPLLYQLVRAVPQHASLVLVGDADQLPSVGPGQALADLIDSGVVPVVRLTEVFRQAAESQIITNAHRIRQGLEPDSHRSTEKLGDFYFIHAEDPQAILSRIRRLMEERIPRRFGLDPVQDVQVLVPMQRSSLGARALNTFLQEFLNPPGKPEVTRFGSTFRVGDKVMQTENDYDKEVFNGDIGHIRHVDPEMKDVTVRFYGRDLTYDFGELDEIVPAYACTIHKSQGSEYPAVIIPLHTQHYMMLHRNVLYTGLTRAKRLAIIVGSHKALALAVSRDEHGRRVSGLRERLVEEGRG